MQIDNELQVCVNGTRFKQLQLVRKNLLPPGQFDKADAFRILQDPFAGLALTSANKVSK